MEPAVYLCDMASLPGAERAFLEANALPRLKELLWLLAPYVGLQIIIAECLLCTLHRLVDAHSQYRCVEDPCIFPVLPHFYHVTIRLICPEEGVFLFESRVFSKCVYLSVWWVLMGVLAIHRRLMVRHSFVPLLVHMLDASSQDGAAMHSAFIRRAASTILARLANRCGPPPRRLNPCAA